MRSRLVPQVTAIAAGADAGVIKCYARELHISERTRVMASLAIQARLHGWVIGYFANGAKAIKTIVVAGIATHASDIRMLKRRRSIEGKGRNAVAGIAIRADWGGQVMSGTVRLMAARAILGDG